MTQYKVTAKRLDIGDEKFLVTYTRPDGRMTIPSTDLKFLMIYSENCKRVLMSNINMNKLEATVELK